MIASVLRLYAGWITVCVIVFFALSGAQDPSRPRGRILSNDAGVRAIAILRATDARRFHDYEAVHVAYARKGEAGDANRWIVLADRVPHTSLREAVVVELRAEDGALLAIRNPHRTTRFLR